MLSKIIYNLKNLTIAKKVGIIAVILALIVSIILITTFKRNVKQDEIYPEKVEAKEESVIIPAVDENNTKIVLSSKDEVENVTITVEEQLKDYDLYYFVKTNAAIEAQQAESETTEITLSDDNSSEIEYTKYENPITIEENSKVFFVYEKGGKYSEKEYVVNIDNIVKKLQETEEVSEEVLKKEKVAEKKVVTGTAPYYIRVNYGANVVTIYGKDEEGNYTKPVKAMICSCGRATPTGGVYKTSRGYDWGSLVGGVYGQYSTRIVGSILFHSVPYTSRSKDSLEYWEFDKLGTKASAGCVRLQVVDAKWIFNNCGSGIMVEFYSSSDPGPLGKPSAPKISGNERCRNWDPTDYVNGNPWLDKNETQQQHQTESKPKEEPVINTTPVQNNTTSSETNNTIINNIVNDDTATVNNNIQTENTIVENTVSETTIPVEPDTNDNSNTVNEVIEDTSDI